MPCGAASRKEKRSSGRSGNWRRSRAQASAAERTGGVGAVIGRGRSRGAAHHRASHDWLAAHSAVVAAEDAIAPPRALR